MAKGGEGIGRKGGLGGPIGFTVVPVEASNAVVPAEASNAVVPAFAGTTKADQRFQADHARIAQPARNAAPPSGVTAPRARAPVSASA